MGILHRLVAVCDECSQRFEYEAPVHHTGEAAADSYGSRELTASDVEHEPELPEGWQWVGRHHRSYYDHILLCPACLGER